MYTTFIASIAIIFVPVGTTSELGVCGKDWYGQYHVNESRIELCTKNYFALSHELGHAVYFELMNESERKQYTSLYNRASIKSKTSGGGVYEDFADAYAMNREGIKTKGYEQRIAFIKRIEKKYK